MKKNIIVSSIVLIVVFIGLSIVLTSPVQAARDDTVTLIHTEENIHKNKIVKVYRVETTRKVGATYFVVAFSGTNVRIEELFDD